MKQLTSLAWKEWREVQAFFWTGIFVFLGLPIIGGVEALFQHYASEFKIDASSWVYMLGGVLAVFVAAGTSCRDFHGRLEDFWRSRPVSVYRWLGVKYLIGLVVVLAACLLPIIVEVIVNGRDHRLSSPLSLVADVGGMLLFWTALYSMAFLAGCLVRKTSHAALLGLAAMLLLYMLPRIVPPLYWMSVSAGSDYYAESSWDSTDEILTGRQIAFDCGMLAITLFAGTLAATAVRRGWQIESGRKTLFGLVAIATLLLCISANFQLGTNLPILQRIELPEHQQLSDLRTVGNTGVFDTWIDERFLGIVPGMPVSRARALYRNQRHLFRFTITDSGIELSTGLRWDGSFAEEPKWADPVPEYHVNESINDQGIFKSSLYVSDATRLVGPPWDEIKWTLLWQRPAAPDERENSSSAVVWRNRLYVLGSRLTTLDVTKPFFPRVITSTPLDYNFPRHAFDGSDHVFVNLPPVPDLPPEKKLELVINGSLPQFYPHSRNTFDGETLCVASEASSVMEYRLTKLTENSAEFQKIGQFSPSPVERFFGASNIWGLREFNGLLYVTTYSNANYIFNTRVTVLDTRSSPGLKVVSHFAAPGLRWVVPLADGRTFVGCADALWLLGPPPAYSHN